MISPLWNSANWDLWLMETSSVLICRVRLKGIFAKKSDHSEAFFGRHLKRRLVNFASAYPVPQELILPLALTSQLLDQIEAADLDSDVVKAFMRTPAVEVGLPSLSPHPRAPGRIAGGGPPHRAAVVRRPPRRAGHDGRPARRAEQAMTGAILYSAILDFLQRADVLGGIVDSLPVVGPIRQEVNASPAPPPCTRSPPPLAPFGPA